MRITRTVLGVCAASLLVSCAAPPKKTDDLSSAYLVPRVVERDLSPDGGSLRVPRQHRDPDLSGKPR